MTDYLTSGRTLTSDHKWNQPCGACRVNRQSYTYNLNTILCGKKQTKNCQTKNFNCCRLAVHLQQLAVHVLHWQCNIVWLSPRWCNRCFGRREDEELGWTTAITAITVCKTLQRRAKCNTLNVWPLHGKHICAIYNNNMNVNTLQVESLPSFRHLMTIDIAVSHSRH